MEWRKMQVIEQIYSRIQFTLKQMEHFVDMLSLRLLFVERTRTHKIIWNPSVTPKFPSGKTILRFSSITQKSHIMDQSEATTRMLLSLHPSITRVTRRNNGLALG